MEVIEVWKDIPNFEGYYQVSNLGKIKSLIFYSNITKKQHQREKIMRQKVEKDGNRRVTLHKDGKSKTYLVARLVATTFLDNNIDTNLTVNHKDGNRANNNVDNLEWVTLADNIRHGFQTGLYSYSYKCVLSDGESEIEFTSFSKASRSIGKSVGYISLCVKQNRDIIGADGKTYTVRRVFL